jgi:hypothetical protein
MKFSVNWLKFVNFLTAFENEIFEKASLTTNVTLMMNHGRNCHYNSIKLTLNNLTNFLIISLILYLQFSAAALNDSFN